MGKFIDLTNKKFGKLTVIELKGKDTYKHNLWLCKCECGKETIVRGDHLKGNRVTSCGCQVKRNHVLHGKYKTRLYKIWENMKQRCYNPKSSRYKDWGGRGIKICDEWLENFMNFYNWAIDNGYADNLSIDRIDNDKNYEPSNCRWATVKEQANNKRAYRRKNEV